MKRLIDVGLEQLASMLFRMGELAKETVTLSISNYVDGLHSPQKVEEMSNTLSLMEESIEDIVFEIMVRFQPVASDLRILKSYMKINYDFVRYGRYALDLSQIYERLGGINALSPSFRNMIKDMGSITLDMVAISVQALKIHDDKEANKLLELENKVDDLYYKYLDKLIKSKITTKNTISSLLAVRYLERIADHATYIGESIVYLSTGKKITLR
jgi:phosphate transport system protein